MRSKFGCSGYTTLLVTSILLLFALIASLASSKGVFFQLKVAQNELKARQEHWKAEGGLECAFAQIKEKMLVLPPSGTITLLGCAVSTTIRKLSDYEYLVTSKEGNTNLSKVIISTGNGLGAVLKTSASVELTGSMHFVPKAKGLSSDSECTSIIAGGTVSYVASVSGSDEHFLTVDSSVSSHATGILGAPSFTCKNSHKSNLFEETKRPTYLATTSTSNKNEDIKENVANISVFKDLFTMDFNAVNVAKLKNEIKADPVGVVIASGKTPKGWVKSCHTKLANAYAAGKRRFWVDGSCAISGNIFGSTTQPVDNAIQLIIYDGVLYSQSMSYFDGLLYQYLSKPTVLDVKEIWIDLFDSKSDIGVTPTSFHKHDINNDFNKYAFLLDGSLKLDGGIGLDAEDRTIKLNGSLIPAYNGGKSGKYIEKLKWQRGSWNDL
ncbi:hypothetical protein [Vibrio parahaemolyticus]|uniref:hypothetical protein n=1 Tax=Vibrio parahaemolyticus TaxID=670 RepID=UPI001E426A87|nr:hypothetical protein [Vibrio parahaemolyticus]HCE2132831.1 hypothetical protein [Vibrio parahaemolyticus]HCE2134672.1 hypothetical protein [Vibrio parahaemolyticus]